ncbi:MAG: hemin uptake protein HemP [Rubrivivax sp.]
MNPSQRPPQPVPGSQPSGPAAAPQAVPCRRLDSRELLAGSRELEIEHAGAIYRLRLTSLGKLILTK